FDRLKRITGLKSVETIDRKAESPIIGLTRHGSITLATKPVEGRRGLRNIGYLRIDLREDPEAPISPLHLGEITVNPKVGKSLKASAFITSRLIDLLANPDAPISNETLHDLTKSFAGIDKKTLHQKK
ncbi:MAG: hypothetical protein ABH950_07065, partial [Candidatus Altiarchaeota archaeon]